MTQVKFTLICSICQEKFIVVIKNIDEIKKTLKLVKKTHDLLMPNCKNSDGNN
jgi:hypothetical protein